MMDTMSGGPPIVAYEKMVTPIVVVQKNAALNERDKHSQWKDRGSGRRRRRRKEIEDDILFEPLLGKLFDYSA